MWVIFKVFTEFVNSIVSVVDFLFCFVFFFLVREACGILALPPGIEPTPPALEGEVLTT